MSPTLRAACAVAGLGLLAPFVQTWIVLLVLVALAAATAVDAYLVSTPPRLRRVAPDALVRGQSVALRLEFEQPPAGPARLRQPVGPDLRLTPSEAQAQLEATLSARRRGRHTLPSPVVRLRGPLGLGQWTHTTGPAGHLRVYPDLPGARRLAASVRQGRFRDEGRRTRGPIGLGTEFETLREYSPDDDIRQVNWLATARYGRPVSNQFRLERDRDVICVVDCGRLSAAPVGEATRLDLALDAAVAVAAVAEELGDRCGALAFDAELRRKVAPRRRGARQVIEALYDLEPVMLESDYERAFHELQRAKRAFVLVLTDLIEAAAAQPLVAALPVLTRHHLVAVASIRDPELTTTLTTPPRAPLDVYRLAAALEVLDGLTASSAQLTHSGGTVVEAAPAAFPAACVSAYLHAKRLARF